jgi:hypothetical protein
MSTPFGNRPGWQHSMLRLVVVFAVAAVALSWVSAGAARADDSLVISAADFSMLHLHPARENVATARSQLGAGLAPGLRGVVQRAGAQASAASGHGRQWRSDAFTLGSARTATATLSGWRRHHHAAAVKLGAGGAAFVQRSRHDQIVQVLWAAGSRLGLIVLRTGGSSGRARAAALSYAELADSYLKTPEPTTAWGKLMTQVRPNGSVSQSTALEAFALSYGSLPGVTVPSGQRTAPISGDLAFDWVAPYLSKLPARQRRVIDHVMGFAAPGKQAHAADYGDPGFKASPALTAEANKWAAIYASPLYLGHLLKLQIIAGDTSTRIANPHVQGDHGEPVYAPADATAINGAGQDDADGPFCRIRITPDGQTYNSADLDHVIAHEVFHCEEFDFDPGLVGLGAWVTEGMAEWAAETVAPSPGYLGVLNSYFSFPATPLFQRAYDAEGFWGRIQQTTSANLWHEVATILAQHSAASQYNAAGGSSANFLSSWGSSMFNASGFGNDWFDSEPQPSPYHAPVNPIDGSGELLAAPYTTSQYTINATAPLERITVSPPGDALLGKGVNRTNLTGVLFCSASSESACQCPPGDDGTVPSSELLGFPVVLGISGDPHGGTTGSVTAIPLSTYCTPKLPPPSTPGADGGTGGDPHMIDFDGGLFDFQQAGEFTLVRSTNGDLDIQVRQQPLSNCCVTFNTAAAMRVGHATVEVDRKGASGLSIYIDKHATHTSSAKLAGGGQLSIGPGVFGMTATITWPDGTIARVFNAAGLGSGVLDVSVALAQDQLGHVSGLLGNAGVPGAKEFPGPSGHLYPLSVFSGTSPHDLKIRYDSYGNSWRITQRESLFRYPRGESTRSYTIRGFPRTYETLASLSPGKRAKAEKACKSAGITSTQLLDACVLDVAATGDTGFAAGDANLQRAVANAPGWTELSNGSAPSLQAPTLGEAGGNVLAAYDEQKSTGVAVASFPDVAGAPSKVAHTTPISGWSDLSSPLLVPTATGSAQLLISGTHSGVAGDSLNGLDTLQEQPDGSFAAPVAIAPTALVAGAASASGAVLASDEHTLIWSTGLFLGVWNNSAYPPVAQNIAYPGDALLEGTTDSTLAYDTSGRLWLVWYALALGNGTPAGLYMEQLNPATGATAPGAAPQLVPDSSSALDAEKLTLACNSVCHIVYPPKGSKTELDSWAPGQATPVTVFEVAPPAFAALIGAAAAPDGRIWITYLYADSANEQIDARLGDDNGAGGTTTSLSPPPGETLAYDGAVLDTTQGLVIAANFAKSDTDATSTLWGTVLPQP